MEEGQRRAGRLKEKIREKEEEMSDRLRSVFLCLEFSVGGVGTVEDVVQMQRKRKESLVAALVTRRDVWKEGI